MDTYKYRQISRGKNSEEYSTSNCTSISLAIWSLLPSVRPILSPCIHAYVCMKDLVEQSLIMTSILTLRDSNGQLFGTSGPRPAVLTARHVVPSKLRLFMNE